MSVLVWLIVPLVVVLIAIVWTSLLARRERKRLDERWRAQQLARRGGALLATPSEPQRFNGSPPASASDSASGPREDQTRSAAVNNEGP